jgi:hypothetical protein
VGFVHTICYITTSLRIKERKAQIGDSIGFWRWREYEYYNRPKVFKSVNLFEDFHVVLVF